MMLSAITTAKETPLHALGLALLFFSIVGAVALLSSKKVRRWWRRLHRGRNFWGYVTAFFMFLGFAVFYVFLAFRN
jgi:hypothetical protein